MPNVDEAVLDLWRRHADEYRRISATLERFMTEVDVRTTCSTVLRCSTAFLSFQNNYAEQIRKVKNGSALGDLEPVPAPPAAPPLPPMPADPRQPPPPPPQPQPANPAIRMQLPPPTAAANEMRRDGFGQLAAPMHRPPLIVNPPFFRAAAPPPGFNATAAAPPPISIGAAALAVNVIPSVNQVGFGLVMVALCKSLDL